MDDTDELVIDFAQAKVIDHSAVEAIDCLPERYRKAGKRLHLRHLSPDCIELLTKAWIWSRSTCAQTRTITSRTTIWLSSTADRSFLGLLTQAVSLSIPIYLLCTGLGGCASCACSATKPVDVSTDGFR